VDGVTHRPLRTVEAASPASLETVMRKSSADSPNIMNEA
jgi:hypothetical protein